MRAVVSFANTSFYQEKMKRLKDSVEAQGVKFIGYTSCEEVGCQPHSIVPYAFKPYAIWKAIEQGVTTILWCDSCIVAIKDLTPVFDYIERHGFMFFRNFGHNLGKWTNDKCLDYFAISREDAMEIPMTMACCQGFCIDPGQGHSFSARELLLRPYRDLAYELNLGSWDNHRHDQSLISCLIHKHKFEMLSGHETFFAYEHFKDVPGWKIADSVALMSR